MKNGAWTEVLLPLMPGYVFVYSDPDDQQAKEFRSIAPVIRVLRYNDGTDILIGRDLEFAEWIWRLGGQIGAMKAVQIGDRIEIVDGLFKQLRGTVTKMDRRRRTVRVCLDTVGTPKQIWLAYEIVEKMDGQECQKGEAGP